MASDYQDRIGDRLDHPELVPPEYAHLIMDDQQRVKRILEFPVSGRVLDVGCSDGAITRRIAETWPVYVVGADIGAHDTTDNRVCWDVRQPFPHREEPFDAAYVCEVLEHLTRVDAERALLNIINVIKSGGDIIVTVPNRYVAEHYTAGCRDRWRWPDHRSVWAFDTISPLLRSYFEEVEFVPLYDGEEPYQSIWLIVRAKGRQ